MPENSRVIGDDWQVWNERPLDLDARLLIAVVLVWPCRCLKFVLLSRHVIPSGACDYNYLRLEEAGSPILWARREAMSVWARSVIGSRLQWDGKNMSSSHR